MCVLTATHLASEALLRFEDHTIWLAVERSCGCVSITPATLADLERGLPLLEGQTDTDSGGEDEIAATSPVPLSLAA